MLGNKSLKVNFIFLSRSLECFEIPCHFKKKICWISNMYVSGKVLGTR